MVYGSWYSVESLDDQAQILVKDSRTHSKRLDRGIKKEDRQMVRNQNQTTSKITQKIIHLGKTENQQ